MSVDTKRAQQIFLAAIAVEAGPARNKLIYQACGEDESLRNRVLALVEAHVADSGFGDASLDAARVEHQPAAGNPRGNVPVHAASTVNPPPRPSTEMTAGFSLENGRYRLLELIGEGGMGAVWLAQQSEPVRRRVALKMVKPGMDSKQVLARFDAERQALALMDHPNIARVFDGGVTPYGRPYFVMEYVKGVSLTEYCDENSASLEVRLQLFVQVCQAVQHAHQKGVVHRDLKPSNILVCMYDGQPVPKVIDFGLAKAMNLDLTDKTLFTGHGLMVGTPLYMSPEQAELNNQDIDTRSDIYSLGVILYELLTGTTPLERKQMKEAALNEMLRLIRDVEPPTPSTRLSGGERLPQVAKQRGLDALQLTRALKGELDWIAMKALDKERKRRYETANALARDVERFLHDEPVEARPPSATYRLSKIARRYRRGLWGAGMFVALLTIATVISLWQARRAGIAEQDALNKAHELERALKRAETAEVETLAQFRAATDDAIVELIGSKPSLTSADRRFLERTQQRWLAFAERQASDSHGEELRAEGYLRMGTILARLSLFSEARAALRLARGIQERLAKDNPKTARLSNQLADTLIEMSALERHFANGKTAVELAKRSVDLRDLNCDIVVNDEASAIKHSASLNSLGAAYRATSELAKAIWVFRESKRCLDPLAERPDASWELLKVAAQTENLLGACHFHYRQTRAARSAFTRARETAQRVILLRPDDLECLTICADIEHNLGNVEYASELGDYGRALFESSVGRRRKIFQIAPGVGEYRARLIQEIEAVARLCIMETDDLARGIECCEEAERVAAGVDDDSLAKWGAAYHQVSLYLLKSTAFIKSGRRDDAKNAAQFAVKAARVQVSANPDNLVMVRLLAKSLTCLAETSGNGGDEARMRNTFAEEAVPLLERVTAIQQLRGLSEEDEEVVEARFDWANAISVRAFSRYRLGRFQEALSDFNLWWKKSRRKDLRPNIMLSRARCKLKASMHVSAMRDVETVESDSKSSERVALGIAMVYSLASVEMPEKHDELGDRAMKHVWIAVNKRVGQPLYYSIDLAPLSEREDFQEAVAEQYRLSAVKK